MNAEARVKQTIGDLIIQLQVALAKNEELEVEIKKFKEAEKK